MRQLELDAISAEARSPALLAAAYVLHLFVAYLCVASRPGTARPVRHHNTGKPPVLATTTCGDPMISHDLQVVLVGAYAQVRGAGKRSGRINARGHIDVSLGQTKFHTPARIIHSLDHRGDFFPSINSPGCSRGADRGPASARPATIQAPIPENDGEGSYNASAVS